MLPVEKHMNKDNVIAFNKAIEEARKLGGWQVVQESCDEGISHISIFDQTVHPDCQLILFRNMVSQCWAETVNAAVVVNGVVMATWHYKESEV